MDYTQRQEISRHDLVNQLRAIGVKQGTVLVVHTAFRNVRPVEGGPHGLIEALLEAVGPLGTLVMPSWTGQRRGTLRSGGNARVS